jgi:hypothetical protein
MSVILVGVVMMAVGLVTLFAMVIDIMAPHLLLALGAYGVAFSGMLLGTFAVMQRLRR